jgi:hypothetical protein
MKNFLKKFENNDTEFFVMKSFVFASFETEMKRPIYHVYYIKKNSNPDAYHKGYMNLKIRKMNKEEIKHFLEVQDKYEVVLWNTDGKIFNLKSKPFDKSQCPGYKQFTLNL